MNKVADKTLGPTTVHHFLPRFPLLGFNFIKVGRKGSLLENKMSNFGLHYIFYRDRLAGTLVWPNHFHEKGWRAPNHWKQMEPNYDMQQD